MPSRPDALRTIPSLLPADVPTLTKHFGIGEEQVRRYLRTLEARGLVEQVTEWRVVPPDARFDKVDEMRPRVEQPHHVAGNDFASTDCARSEATYSGRVIA